MTVKVGDKVVYNNTDYEPEVMRGSVGVVVHVETDVGADIDFGDGFRWVAYANEYTKLECTDTPTLWRDMTDAEKGALLLAKYEGKTIEYMMASGEWVVPDGIFFGHRAYRIKPTPRVVTHKLRMVCHDTGMVYHGTYTTTDGKPDLASIKMEEL